MKTVWKMLAALLLSTGAALAQSTPATVPVVAERIAIDQDGHILVADARAQAVRVFTRQGEPVRVIDLDGRPSSVHVMPDGRLLVGDKLRGRVDIYSAAGDWQVMLGQGQGELLAPTAVAVDRRSGRIHVADSKAAALKIFEASGALLNTINLPGSLPVAMVIDNVGRTYISDARSGHVLVLTATGTVERTIGSFGGDKGQITRAGGLTLGTDGNLYVVDLFQSRLVAFSPDGVFLREIGTYGTEGAGQLAQPVDVATDPDGFLVVSDLGNSRLQRFALTGPNALQWSHITVTALAPPVTSTTPQDTAQPSKEPGTRHDCSNAGAQGFGLLAGVALLLLLRKRRLVMLGMLLPLLWTPTARATDPPHDTTRLTKVCADCHTPHGAPALAITATAGNSNLCISCHTTYGITWVTADQAVPGTSGSSHRWDSAAVNAANGATTPTTPTVLARLDSTGKLMCSTCHNPHSQANAAFDPQSPSTVGAYGRHYMRAPNDTAQMCLDCHTTWNMATAGNGTYSATAKSHPVGVVIPAANAGYNAVPLDIGGAAQVAALWGTSAAGGTTTSLVDASSPFGVAASKVGLVVRFTSGSNKNVTRAITANTANTLTFAAVTTAIGAGITYEVDRDGNITNNLVLQDTTTRSYTAGKVQCITCHGAHYADSNSATYDETPAAGDGRLLRRTANSDAACQGCHKELTHNSTTTASVRPAWGATYTCITCHDPHGTANIWLVRGTINAKTVDYRVGTPGVVANGQATGAGSGPCEVCHTLTKNADNTARFRNVAPFGDSGKHYSSKCTSCHDHMQGFKASCTGCHDAPPTSAAHLVHAGAGGAIATYGGLTTAFDLASPTGYAFGCGQCHPLDPAKHNNGIVEVELYNAAATAGTLKAQSPATASYTPGATTLVDSRGLNYTAGTCNNVACHSGPAVATGAVPQPGTDFAFAGYPITYPAYNVTRTRTYASVNWAGASLTCAGCHGNPIRFSAPGNMGAGDSHSWLDANGIENLHTWNMSYGPLQCRTCHYNTIQGQGTVTRAVNDVTTYPNLPIATNGNFRFHVNGTVDVAFDTVNPVTYTGWSTPFTPALATATYTVATKTCNNVECHSHAGTEPLLNQNPVVWGTPYRFENSYECNVCHRK